MVTRSAWPSLCTCLTDQAFNRLFVAVSNRLIIQRLRIYHSSVVLILFSLYQMKGIERNKVSLQLNSASILKGYFVTI